MISRGSADEISTSITFPTISRFVRLVLVDGAICVRSLSARSFKILHESKSRQGGDNLPAQPQSAYDNYQYHPASLVTNAVRQG